MKLDKLTIFFIPLFQMRLFLLGHSWKFLFLSSFSLFASPNFWMPLFLNKLSFPFYWSPIFFVRIIRLTIYVCLFFFLQILQGAGPVNVNASLSNVKVTGFGKARIVYNKVDPKTYDFHTKLVIPMLLIEGKYILLGRILVIPLRGEGTCWFDARQFFLFVYYFQRFFCFFFVFSR